MRKVIKLKDGSKTIIDTNKDKYRFGLTISNEYGTTIISDVYTHKTQKKKHIDYSVTYTKGNFETKTEIEIMSEW